MIRHFVDLSTSSDAELKTYLRTFENFVYGLSNMGVSAGLLGHNQKNWSFLGAHLKIRRQHLAPEKVLAHLLDSE